MRKADTAAALIVAALGVFTMYQARRLPYSAEYGPGAGFLPLWLGIALLLLSVVLVRNARSGAAPETPDPVIGDEASVAVAQPSPLGREIWRPWLIFFGSTVALAFLFEPLGLWLSTAAFTFVTIRWVGDRAWPATILFTILTPIALYVGFVRLLLVPLPLGPFGS